MPALSDAKIRALKPQEKNYKKYDADGLFLLVTPKNQKWWRLKYKFDGREKNISLGIYPATSLKEAREKKDEAKKLLAQGIDPSVKRKSEKNPKISLPENTLEQVAREWFEIHVSTISESSQKRAYNKICVNLR